jgi:biopolymer transport protein TolQ
MKVLTLLPLGLFTGGVWQILGQSSLFGIIILSILVCFSLVSWAIMLNKWRLFKNVDRENLSFLGSYRSASKLSELVASAKAFRFAPFAAIFLKGYEEIGDIISIKKAEGLIKEDAKPLSDSDLETIAMTLERVTAEEIGALERKVVFLATTANTSPFLGLLGTVVGVMDSFWSIGDRGSASLAVVAPGIAEALLATIVGLGAAIPAVIGYNWANNRLKRFNDQASNFALEFQTRIKKDLT